MKNRYVLLADLPLIACSAVGAYAVRFDWRFYEERPEFLGFLLAVLLIKPVVFFAFGMYRRYWQAASIPDLVTVVVAVSAASVVIAAFVQVATMMGVIPLGFSRIVVFTDWLLTLVTTGGARVAQRLLHESAVRGRAAESAGPARRVLIAGAGAAGTMVAREMRRNPQLGMEAIGFVDDDPGKVGKHVDGLKVFARTSQLTTVAREQRADSIVIAMPTARGASVRRVLEMANEAGIKSQTIPGMFELLGERVTVNRLRNVDIADLLRRSPVADDGAAGRFVEGQVVLVTGAGGSIGSELARQVANARPAHLVMLGHGENSIFESESRLRMAFPHVKVSTVIADIRDARRLTRVFDEFRPSVVFHAAAHKHVPLMEDNPQEAVTNNVIGTRNIVSQAVRTQVDRLVLISTDKAVAPTSVMGATKRIAEALVRKAAAETGRAFMVVRFGNVLGSRGSVVHTFKAQIAQGGPVTVTHPEMNRFFMTIPEAVHLVLQAGGIGRGGELFVLDMGEPVKIVDLARDLITLSGLTEDDVPIVFSGVRPGEKLEEVLYDAGTQTRQTSHPEVLEVVGADGLIGADLTGLVAQLEDVARHGTRDQLDALLWQIIPGFVPSVPRSGERTAGDRVH